MTQLPGGKVTISQLLPGYQIVHVNYICTSHSLSVQAFYSYCSCMIIHLIHQSITLIISETSLYYLKNNEMINKIIIYTGAAGEKDKVFCRLQCVWTTAALIN